MKTWLRILPLIVLVVLALGVPFVPAIAGGAPAAEPSPKEPATPIVRFFCDSDNDLVLIVTADGRIYGLVVGHCVNGRGIVGPRRRPEA